MLNVVLKGIEELLTLFSAKAFAHGLGKDVPINLELGKKGGKHVQQLCFWFKGNRAVVRVLITWTVATHWVRTGQGYARNGAMGVSR